MMLAQGNGTLRLLADMSTTNLRCSPVVCWARGREIIFSNQSRVGMVGSNLSYQEN